MIIYIADGTPRGNTLLDFAFHVCYVLGSNASAAVVSNLRKSIQKDSILVAWNNLRKSVVFQEVKLEVVTLREIYLPVS